MIRSVTGAVGCSAARAAAALVAACLATAAPAAGGEARALARAAVEWACARAAPPAPAQAPPADGARHEGGRALRFAGSGIGWRAEYRLGSGARLVVERLAPAGALRRIAVEHHHASAQGPRPGLLVIAGPDCRVAGGRRVHYRDDGTARALSSLDAALEPFGAPERLDPVVPAGRDPGGVRVALVDAGVNYLLPAVARRLARDAAGRPLGYDYWDDDPRPFDSNPAHSPFFTQRHGTRTASLLLREAPVASLVPYRYPRPDMSRMTALVEAAAAAGVVVVNLSLGSRDAGEWKAFAAAVAAQPGMLFVVSAGNDGADLDEAPVYPAALPHENVLTVTSVTVDGRLARGSNRGRERVDLGVPGEHVRVTGFDGEPRFVSGSSYAAVRVSALAACLLAANPRWRAPDLRRALIARAERPAQPADATRHGVILAPLAGERGGCPPVDERVRTLSDARITVPAPDAAGNAAVAPARRLAPELIVLSGSGWERGEVESVLAHAAAILGRCGVALARARLRVVAGPERLRYFTAFTAEELIAALAPERPAVFFVADTRRRPAFDAEAFGRANSFARPALRDSVWITRATPHAGIALAHELYHVLADSGAHSPAPGNLMQERTSPGNTALTTRQCERMVAVATSNGLFEPLAH